MADHPERERLVEALRLHADKPTPCREPEPGRPMDPCPAAYPDDPKAWCRDCLDLAAADLLSEPSTGEEAESVRCTCEWQGPMDGTVDADWPAELDPQCQVHGDPNGFSESTLLRSHTDREPEIMWLNTEPVQGRHAEPMYAVYEDDWVSDGLRHLREEPGWERVEVRCIGPPVQPEEGRLRAEAEASVRLDGTTVTAGPEEDEGG